MLTKITLKNYTTFIKETSIDFSATNYKFLSKENTYGGVTKGALFVGENASGKTNIIGAINFLIRLLVSNDPIEFNIYKSFYTSEPTFSVAYHFKIDDSAIIYKVKISAEEIIEEELTLNGFTVLSRKGKKAQYEIKTGKTVYKGKQSDISPSLPFLRQLYFDTKFYSHPTLTNLYNFITNSVYIDCVNRRIFAAYDDYERISVKNYFSNGGVEEINKFFKEIHYPESIIYGDSTPASKKSGASFKSSEKFIAFRKNGTDLYVPEFYESTGNINLVRILPSMLRGIKYNSMVIINEFSSGLHNDLEEAVIRYFYHYSKQSQLFFTSHSTNLLNNAIIRPDQIYSVRFDYEKGGSILSRFSDQNPREAQNTEKMYLNGVFDEVPNYNKFYTDAK